MKGCYLTLNLGKLKVSDKIVVRHCNLIKLQLVKTWNITTCNILCCDPLLSTIKSGNIINLALGLLDLNKITN